MALDAATKEENAAPNTTWCVGSRLAQAFDLLPNLIDVLKDVMSASSSQETTRVGDISASVRFIHSLAV